MAAPWQGQNFDVIVVGTGPGGATVARELGRRRQKVLVLEWGSNAPVTGTLSQTIGVGLIPGKSLLFTNQMLSIIMRQPLILRMKSLRGMASTLVKKLKKRSENCR